MGQGTVMMGLGRVVGYIVAEKKIQNLDPHLLCSTCNKDGGPDILL